jgi:hypothetical protein
MGAALASGGRLADPIAAARFGRSGRIDRFDAIPLA